MPSRQQRELAGIACILLAGLIVLAVVLQSSGSAMHLLNGGLVALFGWGVVFVILAVLATGIELLAPWIETMTWGRGLGIGLLVISLLGLLDVSIGHSGGYVGRLEGDALSALAGTAGSILILVAILLGSLVLAFDVSLRETLGALREHYENTRPEEKPAAKTKAKPAEGWHAQNQVMRTETEEPVLVPIQGVAAPAPTPVVPLPELATENGEPGAPVSKRRKAAPAEPVLAVVPDPEVPLVAVGDDEIHHAWVKPELHLLDTVAVRKDRLHDEIKANIKLIEQTLSSFDVQATVIGVNSGPSVTQYELQPGVGVPVRKITALQNDLALALSAAIRIQAPIPG
ncbi:MAG TPA: DNA translocase FtsK 4TM domain-containing protein, partial [Candidatus Dormibacteraeota bacterium]